MASAACRAAARGVQKRALSSSAAAAEAPLKLSGLTAVTGVDGRYGRVTSELRPLFSEYALIKHRVIVEIEWLRVLAASSDVPEVAPLSADAQKALSDIVARFDAAAAQKVKDIEATTNHDVKAVEYFLKDAFAASGSAELARVAEFLHFACTSEDVNNLAYALMVKGARQAVMAPSMGRVVESIAGIAEGLADAPMMSRTHGQPATPTTMGKEFANFAYRLGRQLNQYQAVEIAGKFNGAVGNFNAHVVAYPRLGAAGWVDLAKRLVEGNLGLAYNPYSTQIETHDWLAEVMHALSRYNTVLLGFDRDVWGYISLGYFKQRVVAGEVGSSTMPHKVNPIDFENSEGNLGLANALLGHCAEKLPISRFQRDLSDSTVLRSIGSGFAHSLIAYKSTIKGCGKLQADAGAMAGELEAHYELLAEPIQTVMRRYGAPQPYEQLKALTRGRGAFSGEDMRAFVAKLRAEGQIPPEAADALAALTPGGYIGIAPQLAREVRRYLK